MKKAFSLTLALMILLTSCGSTGSGNDTTAQGGSSSDNGTTAAPETTQSLVAQLGELDSQYKGRTFTFLDANGSPSAHVNIPGDSETGEIINDALYERDSWIEEHYGITIDYVSVPKASDGCNQLKNSVLAGDNDYDFVMSCLMGGALGTIATEGVLANLLDVPHLSLDQKWWSHYMYENLQLDGKMFYTTGDITPSLYQMPACVYVNRDLVEKYNIDVNFYKEVTDGTWTLDRLAEVTKGYDQDLNNDGVLDDQNDFFGFAPQMNTLMTESMLVGAGVQFNTVKDGGINISLGDEYTASVMEKISSTLPKDITFSGYAVDTGKVFSEDRAIVTMHFVEKAINTFRNMKSDYYILPVPKYSDDQEGYRSFVNAWIHAFIGIPSNADLEFSGFVTEALARYSYENVRPKAYDITYKAKAARDEESAEMLDVIFDNVYLDFEAIYDFGNLMNSLHAVAVGDAGLASTIASIQPAANTAAASFVESWLD